MTLAPKTPDCQPGSPPGPKRVTRAVVASMMAFAYMCSSHACRVAKKLKPAPGLGNSSPWRAPASPRSPIIQRPKQLLATISNKAMDACRVAKKLKPAPGLGNSSPWRSPASPRSPMIQRPKQLLATISNKAITLVHRKKAKSSSSSSSLYYEDEDDEELKGGVWQRSILMGDKCQPLDFSGVIYYDSHGKQTADLPIRSPRASPMPSYLQTTQPHF